MNIPLDDQPSYNDLTEQERYVIIAFRRLVDDHKLIDKQVGDWLEPSGATTMSALALSEFFGTLQRHLIDAIKDN